MTSSSSASVLVAEDDRSVRDSLERVLRFEGYEVTTAKDGAEALDALTTQVPDVVVMDVMMPNVDGLTACRMMRERYPALPILMLTARHEVADRVAGLDAGADDYMVKPFAFPELLARARALLRRGRGDQLLKLSVADLQLDVPSRAVTRAGQRVELTPREYELLEYLVRHKGSLVSREMLARDVWQETERGTPLDNVIDVHVARLRRKVDLPGGPRLIHTVRGVGFIVREGEA